MTNHKISTFEHVGTRVGTLFIALLVAFLIPFSTANAERPSIASLLERIESLENKMPKPTCDTGWVLVFADLDTDSEQVDLGDGCDLTEGQWLVDLQFKDNDGRLHSQVLPANPFEECGAGWRSSLPGNTKVTIYWSTYACDTITFILPFQSLRLRAWPI